MITHRMATSHDVSKKLRILPYIVAHTKKRGLYALTV